MLRDRFADAFETVDYMITPTVPAMRKVIGVDAIGGRHYRAVLSYFTSLVNHTLHPAIACPMTGSGAPPVSIQVIGPLGSEAALLGLARDLERMNLLSFRVFRPNSPTAHLG
jgi:Asp-tRNA(Asn)/Glu-tRNA(Gln) amidotransferase A subunit family amidase